MPRLLVAECVHSIHFFGILIIISTRPKVYTFFFFFWGGGGGAYELP